MIYTVLGVLLIAGVLIGLLGIMAACIGWKTAATIWGFSIGMTAVTTVGALLITYGTTGVL